MPKCSLRNRILQLRTNVCAATALCLFTVIQFFSLSGIYNYPHIPIDDIKNELYMERNPNLIVKNDKPDCSYDDILKSKESMQHWEESMNSDYFVPTGIYNGSYVPEHCNPLISVAILITYRNRQSQLNILLPYLHTFLKKQNIHYRIYVIEQQDDKPWNKGVLYNVGAKIAIADKFPCLILHDVDLLPLDMSNLYACTKQPRHLSASIDKFRYILIYESLIGGVTAIQADHYKLVNGFSNKFENWGGEDDDFSGRITCKELKIVRFPREMSRYKMLNHEPQPKNENRFQLMAETRHHCDDDGLSNVRFRSLNKKDSRLATIIAVQL